MATAEEPGSELRAEDLVDILRHAGRQLESSPGVVVSQGEEGLRWILLAAINGATRGRGFAEAFNRRGKTDILVRDNGSNVYIAECKNYGGPKKTREAIGQLLGYTGWRQRHVGLLIFVRSTSMTTAIRSTRDALEDERGIRSIEALDGDESELLAIADHPADPAVPLEITVQLFHLPIPRGREELIGGELADEPAEAGGLLESRGLPAEEEGFAYQTHEGPGGVELPIRPDAVMRLERITPEGRVAIDAIPLDDQAAQRHAPAGQIEFEDEESARQMKRAMRDNVAIEVPGVRMRFDRLPPLFRQAAEEISAADPEHVTVRLSPIGLWQCRMHVATDRGNLEVPMAFAPVETDRDDELAMRGSFHDLALTIRVRRGEEANLEWVDHPTGSPVRERLASLDFLYALSGAGEIRWESIDPSEIGPLSVTKELQELPEELVFDRKFFANLVLLEDHLGVGFDLPEEIEEDELMRIFAAAEAVRTGKTIVLVDHLTLEVDSSKLQPGDDSELHGLVPVYATILGTKFRLGLGRGSFQGRVSAVERQGEVDRITLVPVDDAAARVEVSDIQSPEKRERRDSNPRPPA